MSFDMQGSNTDLPLARNGTEGMTWIGAVNWMGLGGDVVLMVDATAGSPTGQLAALQTLGFSGWPGLIGQGGSNQGAGVVGIASDTDPTDPFENLRSEVLGVNAGVLGISQMGNGVGVKGTNVATGNTSGIGVEGIANDAGVGVKGTNVATGTNSSGTGVAGIANDPDAGIGVFGQANGRLGIGVQAESDNHIAVAAVSGNGTAVDASSSTGTAVAGTSNSGRAAVFRADRAAQVQLVPHNPPRQPRPNQPFAAQALIAKGEETAFPAIGQAGDLLCTNMLVRPPVGPAVELCTLWFCERTGSGKTDPAHWRQVLLGPVFNGQG
jgi:hypothetical protein